MQHADGGNTVEEGLSPAEHLQGSAKAMLTLVEYGDYACPACVQAEPLVRQLVQSESERLRFVYRHYPREELHLHAALAAEAAEAAAAQGKFWPMHYRLLAQGQPLDEAALAGHAQAIGLDMNRYRGEMADHIYTQRVQEHRRAGELSGVKSTPAFFLNDAVIDISLGIERLSHAVLSALKGR